MKKIEKVCKFKCIKDYSTAHGDTIFVKGEVYTSNDDGRLLDKDGIPYHWRRTDDMFSKHFKPLRTYIAIQILKVFVSIVILSFFGNVGIQMLKDGFLGFSMIIFLFGMFCSMMAYFTIEGKKGSEDA